MIRSCTILLLSLFILLACTSKKDVITPAPVVSETFKMKGNYAKNVIFVVGDGMGLTQLSTLMYYDKRPNAFESFNDIGLQKNPSSSDKVTDSAAAATTFATGKKTYNGAIGVDKNKKHLKTIAEKARDLGLSTAIIATSSITHATPASFYAHQDYRKMEDEIAMDLWRSDMDFFAGGGLNFFNKREDKLSGIDSLQTHGYEVSYYSEDEELVTRKALNTINAKKIHLWAENGMPKMQEGRGEFLTDKTLEGLDHVKNNEKGFFMLVEASQIDWGGHSNDHQYIVEEVKDLNTVLTELVKWVQEDGETLLVVTADHETGGYSLSAKLEGVRHDTRKLEPTFNTSYHTATMIPVFAMGPGSEQFRGIYENTEIHNKMLNSLLGNRDMK